MRPNESKKTVVADVPAVAAEGQHYKLTVVLPKGGKHTEEWRESILRDMVRRITAYFEVVAVNGMEIVVRAAKDLFYVAGKAKDAAMGLCTQASVSVTKIAAA